MARPGIRYKLAVVDVDGTLTDREGRIESRVVRALEDLRSAGMDVILSSGNGYPILAGLAYYMPVKRYIIAENGGVIGFGWNYRVLGDRGKAVRARDLIVDRLPHLVYESWQNRFRLVDLAFHPRQGVGFDIALRSVIGVVKGLEGVAVESSGWAIHVRDSGIDKGRGLLEACRDLGIDPGQVVAVGDSDTDIPMFDAAGYSIALANSTPNLKKRADHVTEKSFCEGFVEAAEHIIALVGRH